MTLLLNPRSMLGGKSAFEPLLRDYKVCERWTHPAGALVHPLLFSEVVPLPHQLDASVPFNDS